MNDDKEIVKNIPKDSPLFTKFKELFRDDMRIMKPVDHYTETLKYQTYPECILKIKQLKCLKKNELTKDEICTVMFWAESENKKYVEIPNIILVQHNFKKAGEVFDMNIRIPMSDIASNRVFFIMIYEKDNPALFDPDDPIGLIVFYSNQVIAAYSGNFYSFPKPATYANSYDQDTDITLDAGADGKYRIKINMTI